MTLPLRSIDRKYRVGLRALFAIALAVICNRALIAQGNACCGPPGANPCHAAGCADLNGSTCLGVVLSQVTQCCGTGQAGLPAGSAVCHRTTAGQPQTAWCVSCTSGGGCGGCGIYLPPPCDCQSGPSCCESQTCQGTWMGEQYCNLGSPILVNLRRNGSDQLTSAANGVWFDINARGTLDRVAWTSADSQVGFLVLDRNGNNLIDDGSELFGTATRLRNGQRAPHGFYALFDLDGGHGVSDERIDASDPWYANLRLWIDANHNGVSEQQELSTLPDAGVDTVFTAFRETRRRDQHGNWYRYAGSALLDRPRGDDRLRRIFDVYFLVIPGSS
jgi:hypothetical protein